MELTFGNENVFEVSNHIQINLSIKKTVITKANLFNENFKRRLENNSNQ